MSVPRPLRLGIDLDGVVADFNQGWIELYNRDHGTELHPDDVVVWDAPTELTHFTDMGEFWRWARDAADGRSIFRFLEPYPGAVEALDELARRHEVVILTTKPDFAVHDTYEWIAEHGLPTREVHILDDKARVSCDVYLDDAVHNLENLVRRRRRARVFRFVRPWNRHVPGTVAVRDWGEFLAAVDAIRLDMRDA